MLSSNKYQVTDMNFDPRARDLQVDMAARVQQGASIRAV